MRGPAKPDADPLIAPVAGFCHIVCALGHPAAILPLYSAIPPGDGQAKLRQWRLAAARFAALLLLTLIGCMLGLLLLDDGTAPVADRAFRALWNSANTISTLGDLDSLNHAQKAFMIGAMFTLVTVGGYAITNLTGVLSASDVLTYREYRRVEKRLVTLERHVVVAGFGVIGRRVANRMRVSGSTVVVVEYDPDRAAQASGLGYLTVLVDASRDQALPKLRLETAAALFITLTNPDRKLALTLIARNLSPHLPIIVADDSDAEVSWLPHAGASRVVLIDDLVADAMVQELAKLPPGP